MKLRNKETGEIGELLKDKKTDELFVRTSSGDFCYNSLTELCKEWEAFTWGVFTGLTLAVIIVIITIMLSINGEI